MTLEIRLRTTLNGLDYHVENGLHEGVIKCEPFNVFDQRRESDPRLMELFVRALLGTGAKCGLIFYRDIGQFKLTV